MLLSTEVRVHGTSEAAPTKCGARGRSYAARFHDACNQALDGKPLLCAPSRYGNGFYDGWRSVRYPDDAEIAKG
jgi:hypothetical protein